jgi:hypothetical protein
MKVKFYLFTHPQWHLMLGYYKVISVTYILSRIELEAKRICDEKFHILQTSSTNLVTH